MSWKKPKAIRQPRHVVIPPMPSRGWRPDYKFAVFAKSGFDRKFGRRGMTYAEASALMAELSKTWDMVFLREIDCPPKPRRST